MAKRKSNPAGSTNGRKKHASVRDGGTRIAVENSGLEAWLYDDGNLRLLRDSGALDFETGNNARKFRELARKGVFVGYSLEQDDALDIEVHIGRTFTKSELAIARWLEPQTALLRIPTGKLCVESNDARRVGQEVTGAKGGMIKVPAGDYRLTLYRIDHEALDRDGISWKGAQEVIVLTPGGKAADAVDDLLPFELRRDLAWVGKYKIHGRRAEALVWFGDYWDTFVLNLDSAAASKLALAPATYLRVNVPSVGLTIVCSFGSSWDQARRFPLPSGIATEEYAYSAFSQMSEWNQKEALFCRREKTTKRVEDKQLRTWLPAVVEVFEVKHAPKKEGRVLSPIKLESLAHLLDPGFLSLILSDVLPEVADMDELPLPDALKILDKKLAKMGAQSGCDYSWQENLSGPGREPTQVTCRLYVGLQNAFVVVVVCEGIFELLVVSEGSDKSWIVTGLADDMERLIKAAGRPGLQIKSMDESLATIVATHRASLSRWKNSPAAVPGNASEGAAAFTRFLMAAFG